MYRYVPLIALLFALPAGATTYQSIQNDALIGHDPGADGLWGTADDFIGEGFNTQGHAQVGLSFDVNGDLFAAGYGLSVTDFPDFNTAVNLGPTTNFTTTVVDSDAGFNFNSITDPTQSPHTFTSNADNTFDFAYTNINCEGLTPGCADPLSVLSIFGSGFYWTVDEDPTAIDSITMSPVGDLSGYALLLESLAPDDATAYSFAFGLFPLTEENLSGSAVPAEAFGGNFFFSSAFFSTDPLSEPGPAPIPEPTTALLVGLGLLGLASRRRAA